MDMMKMHTPNQADDNFKKLADLFPNAVTESIDPVTGEVVRAIDKDVLMQEISARVVEGREERYQFTWPDKKKAVLAANAPIAATLRPVRDESVGKDGTPGEWDSQNLYIEGDNLDVLKLLQETYLGKIKMIYIDPPYNTGNDFIYEDDFAEDAGDYLARSGQFDDQGNRLEQNTESNGRFHTDWLNMMYPRLRLAKNLLSDDGAIFISIDDNEQDNLIRICKEIFGARNCVATIVWQKRYSPDSRRAISDAHEYILCFAKNPDLFKDSRHLLPLTDAQTTQFKNPDNDPRGPWKSDNFTAPGYRPNQMYEVVNPAGEKLTPPPGRCWRVTYEGYLEFVKQNRMYFGNDGKGAPGVKRFLSEMPGMVPWTWWPHNEVGHTQEATKEAAKILNGAGIFDYPKPTRLIKRILQIASDKESIVLDFFSGSATTAHAAMQLNAEDGGHRKCILIQVPETIDPESEAAKAGFKTICDIGKERIRRAGMKIKEEAGLTAADLDVGFRVLRLDSSNMEDVYYNPDELSQDLLGRTVDNIKLDRTPEDLLFQMMLDLGVDLSSTIEERVIAGKKVFVVKPAGVEVVYLVVCFDKGVTAETVTEIAKMKPYYAVFRDSGMASDSVVTNFDQIFRTYSPQTERKVL